MKYILLFILSMTMGQIGFSQKMGHVNYGNLLESLPQVDAADKRLASYQDSLGVAFEARMNAHRKRIEDNQAKFAAGEMTKVDADATNKSLNENQVKLAEDQQKAEATIMLRRQAYLQPIIVQVNDAIAEYAKANAYAFIFDESSGFLLHDLASDDLTDVIRGAVTEEP